MKTLKRIIRLIIVFTVILVISLLQKGNSSYAANVSYYNFLQSYPHYDNIKGLSFSALSGYRFGDEEYVTNGGPAQYWTKRSNILCLEKSNNFGTGWCYVTAILDINADGLTPDKMTVTTSSGSKTIGPDARIAELACLAYLSESRMGGFDGKYSFVDIWEDQGLRGYVQSQTGKTMPSSYEDNDENYTILQSARAYMNTYNDPGNEKLYQARILLMSGGASQDRGFMFGKPINDNRANFEIHKYISSVTKSDGTPVPFNSRSGKDEDWKYENPLKLISGEIYTINYTITIQNTGNDVLTGTLVDEYQSKYLTNLRFSGTGAAKVSGGTSKTSGKYTTYTKKNITLSKKGTTGDKISFTATLTGTGGSLRC